MVALFLLSARTIADEREYPTPSASPSMKKPDKATKRQTVIERPLHSESTREAIGELVDTLDERYALEFFDFFHPQISDPGAYVAVHREGDGLQFQLGNHGWQSAWQPITRDDLVDYIHKNREYNEGRLILKARYMESRSVKTETGTSQTSYDFDIRDKK